MTHLIVLTQFEILALLRVQDGRQWERGTFDHGDVYGCSYKLQQYVRKGPNHVVDPTKIYFNEINRVAYKLTKQC